MKNIFFFINQILASHHFLLAAEILTLILKTYILTIITISGLRSSKIQKPWIFFILMFVSSIVVDIGWVVRLIELIFYPSMDYRVRVFFIRIAWVCAIAQYQFLALFIESLAQKKNRLNLRQKIFIMLSSIYAAIFLYLAIFKTHSITSTHDRFQFEFVLLKYATIYIFCLILPSLFAVSYKLYSSDLPKILKKQLKILILGLILPLVILDFIQVYPFNIIPSYIASNYTVVAISTILITCAAFYCTKKVMLLRFLNFKSHVQSQKKYSFINKFTHVLDQLSHTTGAQELIHITKNFFKEDFEIPTGRTNLYIRNLHSSKFNENEDLLEINKTKIEIVETFINSKKEIEEFLKQSKALIYDEIDFSDFYIEHTVIKDSVNFLNKINAEIFIPIYKKQTMIAYIIVERDNRSNQIYSNLERDEMIIFSKYLGNIINLLQTRNFELLIAREKELKEELYLKHQEINQYKESIRSFLKNNQLRKIGIIFYKNRKFIFANQDSKELIPINVNILQGHSISQDLKNIAKQIEEYKSSQTCYSKDPHGNKLILMGMQNPENNNIIILAYYPDISDIVRQQIDLLKDPSKWDYLLYLETTKSGQLITQLIPGCGEILLNFKINLLKVALSREAILLEMPEEDLVPTVEIIQHISLRENLHILNLQSQTKNLDIGIKLFGINHIFEKSENGSKPLLQKLDNNGTLFIQNIHFLDLETQEHLANFIKNGYFHILKSDQKITSDVRLICSTNVNLKDLVLEGKFSKSLYELLKSTLIMPSLFTLPEEELNNLAQGYSEQAIRSDTFKNLLELTDKEKKNIINKRPVSLKELKAKVQQILTEKSKKNNVHEETHFDPAYNITDPKLIEAARLGKHALKDPKMLGLLWSKFKNQNKIATFLGVNRSSVHRRFKEYKIE